MDIEQQIRNYQPCCEQEERDRSVHKMHTHWTKRRAPEHTHRTKRRAPEHTHRMKKRADVLNSRCIIIPPTVRS